MNPRQTVHKSAGCQQYRPLHLIIQNSTSRPRSSRLTTKTRTPRKVEQQSVKVERECHNLHTMQNVKPYL